MGSFLLKGKRRKSPRRKPESQQDGNNVSKCHHLPPLQASPAITVRNVPLDLKKNTHIHAN